MYSARKVKTKSGSIAVQVVQYVGHRSIIWKHIGNAKDEIELTVLRQRYLNGLMNKPPDYRYFPFRKKRCWLLTGERAPM